MFGWLVSLAIVVTVTVLGTGGNNPARAEHHTDPLAQLAVKIAIGADLVAIAIRHRRRIGRPKPPKKPPKWQAHVDTMSPWFAMGLAPALQPWGLIGAGAATVVGAKPSSWESYLALFPFCVLASPTWPWTATPVSGPTRARRSWPAPGHGMDTRTDQVIIVGSLILGILARAWKQHLPDRQLETCREDLRSMRAVHLALQSRTWPQVKSRVRLRQMY